MKVSSVVYAVCFCSIIWNTNGVTDLFSFNCVAANTFKIEGLFTFDAVCVLSLAEENGEYFLGRNWTAYIQHAMI